VQSRRDFETKTTPALPLGLWSGILRAPSHARLTGDETGAWVVDYPKDANGLCNLRFHAQGNSGSTLERTKTIIISLMFKTHYNLFVVAGLPFKGFQVAQKREEKK
jgi:hypothetical protein